LVIAILFDDESVRRMEWPWRRCYTGLCNWRWWAGSSGDVVDQSWADNSDGWLVIVSGFAVEICGVYDVHMERRPGKGLLVWIDDILAARTTACVRIQVVSCCPPSQGWMF
jgi:hypothetical protein